ncbi:hypothetical protein BDDG_09654 [Blastomyces dermatitidis ATCC 18188]|uniref:Uncharacterized protein n=1 Tax=Ajellomyces dermatitidis (strain ATCC 18188 / CBS 674.68) TaxID=653446 RepID=F2TTZ1_AJEDA|nr:hypothetical protein BDDG_09654 [Blastomyces dermatitidis ATCC 18188]
MIVHLNSKVAFTVRGPSILTNAKCSVSSQAFTYLSDFCHRHNLENQAKAGLGAALTFPSPLPASIHLQPVPDKTNISQPPKPSLEDSFSLMTNLMTISSAVTGLTATLNVYTPEPVNWRLVASKHNHWLLLKEVRSGTPFSLHLPPERDDFACLSRKTWNYMPPWKPHGRVIIDDTHIVVQEHSHCTGHYISYKSWSWLCADGRSVMDLGYSSQHSVPAAYGMTPGDIDESDMESHDPEGRSNDMGGIQDWFANTREGYTLNGNSLPSYDTVMTS